VSTLTTNYLTPTGREEAWRFTPLARIKGLHDSATLVADRISLSSDALPAGVTLAVVASDSNPPASTTDDIVVQRVRDIASEITLLSIAADDVVDVQIALTRSSG